MLDADTVDYILAMLDEHVDRGPAGESGAIRAARDRIVEHVASLREAYEASPTKVSPLKYDGYPRVAEEAK